MIRVQGTDLRVLPMCTRLPFKYGIATLTELPHLFVRVEAVIDGQHQWGVAADGLPPKWFTKDPMTTFAEDLAEMVAVIQSACQLATAAAAAPTLFAFWRTLYQNQQQWASAKGYPPLLWGFGVSLVERALIDAFCRARRLSFAQAVQRNELGIQLDLIHPELQGLAPADLLPAHPQTRLHVRHTVGLADPLTDADIADAEQLQDGLPQSLAACIRTYGLTHFKLKVAGDPAADLVRLQAIAAVLEAEATPAYQFTLDGNEQYKTVESFQHFWAMFNRALPHLQNHLLFVEQPFHRDVALTPDVQAALLHWRERPPMIIDESDGALDSLRIALQGGYDGTSHKNCKGVFKGVANACLLAYYRRNRGDERPQTYLLSGEDLANVGPVALLQDLAVLATLGVSHAERNGHHYFAGLSMFPPALQAAMVAKHGDLYQRQGELVTLVIRHGAIDLASVVIAPFGYGIHLATAQFTPLAEALPLHT